MYLHNFLEFSMGMPESDLTESTNCKALTDSPPDWEVISTTSVHEDLYTSRILTTDFKYYQSAV